MLVFGGRSPDSLAWEHMGFTVYLSLTLASDNLVLGAMALG